MRRAVFTLLLVLFGLYAILHFLLATSPVQKRVVAELQQVLSEYGFVIEMESIEFSAFSPKIYINRVKLTSTPKSSISLPEPLSIDKIKIQFSPLALLFRRIVINDLILFHPRIQVPHADKLYHTAMGLFGSRDAIKVDRSTFDVFFHKIGVVDALFNIGLQEPPFAVRSRSLTVIMEKGSGQQRSVLIQSNDLELDWDKRGFALNKVDVDIDIAAGSLRVNKAIIENQDFAVNLVGVSKMPTETDRLPKNLSVSYDIKVKLPFLKSFPELGNLDLTGSLSLNGTLKKDGELLGGKGQVTYDGVAFKRYEVGSGTLAFNLEKHRVLFSQAALRYAGGEFHSRKLALELDEHLTLSGDLAFHGLLLEAILKGVRVERPPVAMEAAGQIKVSGTLNRPFQLTAELDAQTTGLQVLDDLSQPKSTHNVLMAFGDGRLKGSLVFTMDKMAFDAGINVLGGTANAKGYIGFDDDKARVQVTSENTSLTQLRRIATLDLGGIAKINAEVTVDGEDANVKGAFEIQGAEVAGLELGSIRGEALYQGLLLTFENLELPSLESIRGNGYVDFKGTGTRYKFYVNGRRMQTDQVFTVLKNLNIGVEVPKHGEMAARISVEGGGETEAVRVSASGQAKNFDWFDEHWVSGSFSLGYQEGVLELTKALLTKPSGAVEVLGRFGKKDMRLRLATFGLDVSHFEHFGNAPLTGEIAGELFFEGSRQTLFRNGRGELKLVKAKFRGVPIPDSTVRLRPDGDKLEYLFNLGTDRLRGRFVRSPGGKNDELLMYFQEYDFAPLLTMALSRDVPPLSDLKATGDVSITGNFEDPGSLKGSGTITHLLVGLKGTPMRIHQPALIKMDQRGVRIDSLFLQGEDSQFTLALNYEPDRRLDAQIDGRIDLQYLQPFIPGLDYGTGKVSVGLRFSGVPSRFQLLGNVAIESGTFRLSGFSDEFRSVDVRMSISQERINIDKFESNVNGGTVVVGGNVRVDRFRAFVPNLRIRADKVVLRLKDYLSGKLSGEFTIRGKNRPYLFGGHCDVLESNLTRFDGATVSTPSDSKTPPLFNFDIECAGSQKQLVTTDIMQAEFRGAFHLVGDDQRVGLLGSAESLHGFVFFRDTRFNLESASIKFESPTEILPRFRVAGRATVKEIKTSTAVQRQGVQEVQNYDIVLQVFGTPSDYKIRLISTPPLVESEIISLLVLGVTSSGQTGGGDNYAAFGSALVGQIPLQSKLKSELGVNIGLANQSQGVVQQGSSINPGASNTDLNSPAVRIQKQLSENTRLSYSNSFDTIPVREFRLEQLLDEHITVNATAMDGARGTSTSPTQAYGLDFRYRFQFE